MNHLIISCIGPDRSGLVDTLSKIIKKHQGNWQVSSLHHLSGFFAGVIEVAVSKDNTRLLTEDLSTITDLHCKIELAKPNIIPLNDMLMLDLTANDRAGIVQEISSVIHHQGGNLIKLISTPSSAAHTGQVIFTAKAQIAINNESVEHLVEALEQIADDLMVDITR